MPKQIVARVYMDYEDGEYGPDYALIEVDPQGFRANLEARMQSTIAMSLKHGGKPDSLSTAPLQGTLWWLTDMPLKVKWLRYDALCDEEGDEPNWMSTLIDEGWVVVEEFEPKLGDEDEDGCPENEFTAVDLQYVLLTPDGCFSVQAHVDSGSYPFRTPEVPLFKLLD